MTPTFTTYAATGIRHVLIVALLLAVVPVPTAAQSGGTNTDGPVRLGPLDLSPVLSWNTVYDDNVFRGSERPVSDIISTVGASTGVRGQIRRVGLSASGSANWVHFDKLVSERGANLGAAFRVNFLFNRVVPYVSSSYRTSRERVNPEIDTRPRSEGSTITLGSAFQIGAKTAFDISVGRATDGYHRDATVDGVNLSEALNRASDYLDLSLYREITPLTRLTMTGVVNRDRFSTSSRRTADNIRLTTGFDSSGVINGSARVGVRILRPHDSSLPESRGLFVSLGTGFTVLDRLQIGLDGQRDFAPSYRPNVAYYGSYSYTASFTYAVLRSLRLSAQLGRRVADYRGDGSTASAGDYRDVDHERSYGSSISYRVRESVGIDFSGTYTERTSTSASRQFDGLSLRAGVSYAF